MNVEVGMRGEASLVVTDADTAVAMRSGSVDVLATPRIIALCEEAACAAMRDRMKTGHTTVGMRVQIDHLHPTGVGGRVAAEAILEKVEGRRLTFTVSASDAKGLVACGKVTRIMVDIDHFMDKSR